jgi:hypothetical protein
VAFLDDVLASQARLAAAQAAAQAEHAAAVEQLRGVLFARLRPVTALSGGSDVVLNEACLAFANSFIQGATA